MTVAAKRGIGNVTLIVIYVIYSFILTRQYLKKVMDD